MTEKKRNWKPATQLVHEGTLRSGFGEMSEAMFLTQGYHYASAEQADGIAQVNKALNQMDEVTQQNSALVEENAATAKTLEHQAKAMDERVAVFKIEDEPTGEAGGNSSIGPAMRSPGQSKRKGAAAA